MPPCSPIAADISLLSLLFFHTPRRRFELLTLPLLSLFMLSLRLMSCVFAFRRYYCHQLFDCYAAAAMPLAADDISCAQEADTLHDVCHVTPPPLFRHYDAAPL